MVPLYIKFMWTADIALRKSECVHCKHLYEKDLYCLKAAPRILAIMFILCLSQILELESCCHLIKPTPLLFPSSDQFQN